MRDTDRIRIVFFGSIPTAAECLEYVVKHPRCEVLGVVTEMDYRCPWAAEKPHVAEPFTGVDITHEQLRRAVGADAHINFEYVNSGPLLTSGKRPYYQ